jgi:uncharacterized protein YidB (DUF937 family)
MSFLNTLGGAAGAPGATPQINNPKAAIVAQILALLQNRAGGIGGLLQTFQQSGLGHVFQSWLSTGPNLPISADQLRSVLGNDWIARIAQATGLPPEKIEQELSVLLPRVVDHVSPDGQIPHNDLQGALPGLLQRLLHG